MEEKEYKFCTRCGAKMPKEVKFCMSCGNAFKTSEGNEAGENEKIWSARLSKTTRNITKGSLKTSAAVEKAK